MSYTAYMICFVVQFYDILYEIFFEICIHALFKKGKMKHVFKQTMKLPAKIGILE